MIYFVKVELGFCLVQLGFRERKLSVKGNKFEDRRAGGLLGRGTVPPALASLLAFSLVFVSMGTVAYGAALPGLAAESPFLRQFLPEEVVANTETPLGETGEPEDGAGDSEELSDAAAGNTESRDSAVASEPKGSAEGSEPGAADPSQPAGGDGLVTPDGIHVSAGSLADPDDTPKETSDEKLASGSDQSNTVSGGGSSSGGGSTSASGQGGSPSSGSGSSNSQPPASSGSPDPVPEAPKKYFPETGNSEDGLSPEMEADILEVVYDKYDEMLKWEKLVYGYWNDFQKYAISGSMDQRKTFRGQTHDAVYPLDVAWSDVVTQASYACGLNGSSYYGCSIYSENVASIRKGINYLAIFCRELNEVWCENCKLEDPSTDVDKWMSELPMGSSGLPLSLEIYEECKRKALP